MNKVVQVSRISNRIRSGNYSDSGFKKENKDE